MKRVKRANGQGGIDVVKRLSKPYRVRVTIFENGIKKRKVLGYYKTYKEAQRVLEEYILKPWDLDRETTTIKDVYKQFIKYKKQEEITEKTLKGYEYAFNRCEEIHNKKINDIHKVELKLFIETLKTKTGTKASTGTKKNTKILLNMLFEFAKDNNIISNNICNFDVKTKEHKEINIFTNEEINRLWDNISNYDYVDVILIMIYSGLRIEEITTLEKDNIDLINAVIKHGGKTSKGKNRVIPIHSKIYELIKNRCEATTTKYLLDNTKNKKIIMEKIKDKPLRTQYLREQFYKIMDHLGMEHKPHDTRKTTASVLAREGVKDNVITDIIGHTDIKTTNKYYIKNDIETLKNEIEKIN